MGLRSFCQVGGAGGLGHGSGRIGGNGHTGRDENTEASMLRSMRVSLCT